MKGKKTGGRKKGIPNKTTKETREFLSNLLNGQSENIEVALNYLHERKEYIAYLNAVIKLLPYVAPRLKQVDGISLDKEPTKIHIFRTNTLLDD